jgi:hypothetical protein
VLRKLHSCAKHASSKPQSPRLEVGKLDPRSINSTVLRKQSPQMLEEGLLAIRGLYEHVDCLAVNTVTI